MLATWGTSTGRNPTLDLQFAGATSLDNRITFSRGSQATLFDSTGALVYAKHNLLTYSQEFDNAAWTKGGATVTADSTTAPSGTTTADTLVEDTSTGQHRVYRTTSGTTNSNPYTISFFAKANTRTRVYVGFVEGTTFVRQGNAVFDLSAGTVVSASAGSGGATGGSATIQNVGNGWYRCAYTLTLGGTDTSIFNDINLVSTGTTINYTGNGTSGLFIWGAQLNLTAMEGGVTSSLSTYYPTVASAYYAPRFDYNPSTLAAQGLLIEEQRTNSIRNNTMQGAVAGTPGTAPTNWTNNITAGLTQEIVGTGTENGITYIDWRLSGTATGTSQIAFESTTQITAAASQAWTATSYARLVAGSLTNVSSLQMCIREGTAAGGFVRDETANFTPTSAALRTQRASVSIASTNALTERVMPRIFANTVGAVDFTLRIGLPQLEQGAFATSVIPTTTTALTRNADVASMTGTNFSSWFNAAAGSLLVQFSIPAQSSATSLATIGDGTANERMIVNAATNRAGTGWRVVDGGVDQCDINITSSFSAGQSVKTIGAYAVNDFAVCQNGGTVGTDVSGTLPTVNALYIGTNGVSTYTNSYIQRISYYPVRLPNSTLQALTA